jgi:hypothetical protein
MPLFTTIARRRRAECWRREARCAAERLHAAAQRCSQAGDSAQAARYGAAALKALLYVARCDRELERLG